MKTIVLVLFTLCSITVFSQSGSNVTESANKIKIGFSITPEFNNLISGNIVGQEKVKSEIGFSASINLEFYNARKISLRTGIGYGKKNYEHIHSGLIFGNDIDPLTGYFTESRIESKISFSEFQIPLVFQYELKANKFFIASGIEIIFPFANNSESIIYYGNGETEKLSNSNNNGLNFAPVLITGYKFPVSDKLSISIEPMFKLYLKEYIIGESHLYNYGIKASFNFSQ